jgi:hypothetical protein
MKKYELMTMMLSCLYWKKYEGKIKLYCDTPFYDYMSELGLLWLWDSIDTKVLDNLPEDIDYNTYWAFPKMIVNSLQTTEFCNLDLDFFSRVKINHEQYDLVASHIELADDIQYFYPDYIVGIPKKSFNVCFLKISDLETYKDYFNYCLEFVLSNKIKKGGSHKASLMIFVEQRLLYNFFKDKKTSVLEDSIYDSNIPDFVGERKDEYFHLWNLKEDFLDGFEELKEFYTNALDYELSKNFPNEYRLVQPAVLSVNF